MLYKLVSRVVAQVPGLTTAPGVVVEVTSAYLISYSFVTSSSTSKSCCIAHSSIWCRHRNALQLSMQRPMFVPSGLSMPFLVSEGKERTWRQGWRQIDAVVWMWDVGYRIKYGICLILAARASYNTKKRYLLCFRLLIMAVHTDRYVIIFLSENWECINRHIRK